MTTEEQQQFLQRITYHPGIFGGKAIIRGIRFRVVDVLECLASGMSPEEIFESYPFLEEADITASLIYAARQVSMNEAHAV